VGAERVRELAELSKKLSEELKAVHEEMGKALRRKDEEKERDLKDVHSDLLSKVREVGEEQRRLRLEYPQEEELSAKQVEDLRRAGQGPIVDRGSFSDHENTRYPPSHHGLRGLYETPILPQDTSTDIYHYGIPSSSQSSQSVAPYIYGRGDAEGFPKQAAMQSYLAIRPSLLR